MTNRCPTDEDVLQVPAYPIPTSPLLSPEGRAALRAFIAGGASQSVRTDNVMAWRQELDAALAPVIERTRQVHAVEVEPQRIAGVPVEIITPVGGVPAANRDKVLVELHGGGFVVGAGIGGQLESIPVAALGQYRVVAVDYRQFPEARYPAATEDAVAVFRDLAKSYDPGNIGVFGCSAGAVLTGQLVAWLADHREPGPGAISMSCAGAGLLAGDSNHFASPLAGLPSPKIGDEYPDPGYFRGVAPDDEFACPASSPRLLRHFPPALLLSGTRDFALSSVLFTNEALIAAGVATQLRVWDGMPHGFMTLMPDVPEAQAANAAIAAFFKRHLGSSGT